MTRVKKFAFRLDETGDDGSYPLVIDEDEEGIQRRWMPFSAESDPESGTVWIWAYLVS